MIIYLGWTAGPLLRRTDVMFVMSLPAWCVANSPNSHNYREIENEVQSYAIPDSCSKCYPCNAYLLTLSEKSYELMVIFVAAVVEWTALRVSNILASPVYI